MAWEREIEELEKRRAFAAELGGEEGIARQRRRGKLTVRERIDAMADKDSWQEFRSLMGQGEYDDEGKLTSFMPKGSVEGTMRLNGRKVVVSAGDFTVRGGSGGSSGGIGQEIRASERARRWRLPYVRLLDSAGGSVRHFEEIGRTYLPDGNEWSQIEVGLLSQVPVVSAVMGSVAGLPAVDACIAHFNLMVSGISQLFPGGPPVVKASLGYDISKEDLGGEDVHIHGATGSVDNLAETEDHAFAMIRDFLSYLPPSVWEMAPRQEIGDDPQRRDEWLIDAVPHNRRRPYDVRKIINSVVDQGSFFEIAPLYGKARVTGLARIDGYPCAVMSNNPYHQGGATGPQEGDKVIRLLSLADTFHLPIISFADEPGFLVGLESEKMGIERAGARLVAAVCESRAPWLAIVTGQLFGVAGQCQHRPSGMFERFVWPSAAWGSMHIEGGTHAAYRRQIDDADDPVAEERRIEATLKAIASPFRTAESSGQEIIDPRDSRPLAVEFVRDAQAILRDQVGPPVAPYRP